MQQIGRAACYMAQKRIVQTRAMASFWRILGQNKIAIEHVYVYVWLYAPLFIFCQRFVNLKSSAYILTLF